MKKLLALVIALVLLFALAVTVAESYGDNSVAEEADVYTSASTTKTVLSGEARAAAVDALVKSSADLATRAEAGAEGYIAPESVNALILSVNPDGSVGLSTISQWKYVTDDAGDQVILELTHGQNALNLSRENAAGSLLLRLDGASYIVHLRVKDADEQAFSQEAYDEGQFNAHYSGAQERLSSYTITCDATAIEVTYALIF